MKYTRLIACLLCLLIPVLSSGQSVPENKPKNYLSIQLNNHLEKRGSDSYYTSNPDLIISYERTLLNFGNSYFLLGLRTGGYKEYVLTGSGWTHPEKIRFFLGASPSLRLDFGNKLKLQVNFILDILLPDDYDETWWYFAVEPSLNYYFTPNIYVGLSAAMGIYPYFNPTAYMDKAGLKMGFCF